MIRPEDVEHFTWPANARHTLTRNIDPGDHPHHPQHRADVPYDYEAEEWDVDGLDGLAWPRVLFACAVFAALLIGLTCGAVGLVLDSPPASFTGTGLVIAGAVGMRVLWKGGDE